LPGWKAYRSLIHISELSENRINHPKEAVKEGDTLTLRVIRIDSDQRRIGLSLRRWIRPPLPIRT